MSLSGSRVLGVVATGALAATLALAGCASGVQGNGNASADANVSAGAGSAENAAASNADNGSAAENADGQDAVANGNANANASSAAATPIVDGDAEDADGVLPDGWYEASLSASSEGSSPAFTAVSIDGDTWTLVGTAAKAVSEDGLASSQDRVGPGIWRLSIAQGVTLEAGGGDSGPQTVERSEFEDTMSRLNGLGLVLHVESGSVTYARLAS